jgi:cytoskeletal protein CcmA (bactofilin family)
VYLLYFLFILDRLLSGISLLEYSDKTLKWHMVSNMFSKPTTEGLTPTSSFSKEPRQRRSLLHDGIVIQGDWQSDGTVEFGGRITGDLTVDVLVVTGTGNVDGNVRARSVTVEGYLNGTIAAVEVVLGSTAVVRGEVVAEKIRIDFGANVEGRLLATGKPETDSFLTQDKASDAATEINDSLSLTPRLL